MFNILQSLLKNSIIFNSRPYQGRIGSNLVGLIPGLGISPGEGIRLPFLVFTGFPGGLDGKESACNAGDLDLIPGLGRAPGRGHGNPLQYSYLGESPWTEEPGRLQSTGPKSRTRLSTPLWFLKMGRPASFSFSYK